MPHNATPVPDDYRPWPVRALAGLLAAWLLLLAGREVFLGRLVTVAPRAGDVVTGKRLELDWNAAFDTLGVRYEAEVDTLGGRFDPPRLHRTDLAEPKVREDDWLEGARAYIWRARAWHGTTPGPWSAVETFRTE